MSSIRVFTEKASQDGYNEPGSVVYLNLYATTLQLEFYDHTLPGNVYDSAEYTHKWIFQAWQYGDGVVNYSDVNLPPYYFLADDSIFNLGATVQLLTWLRTEWIYWFRIHDKQGVKYYITYNGNSNTGGSTSQSTAVYGSPFTFENNGFTRTGYDFKEWRLNGNGNGNYIGVYRSGQVYGNWFIKNNCTATAEWNAKTSTITYVANGGTGTMTTTSIFTYNSRFTFLDNTFLKTGYTFEDWHLYEGETTYLENYGAGLSYTNWTLTGTSYTAKANWSANQYTIAYDANGGLGTMNSSTATYASNFTFQKNSFTKNGFSFAGWWLYIGTSTSRVNDATTYSDKSTFYWDIDKNLTAKAQWVEIPPEEIRVTYLPDLPDVLYSFFKHTFSTCGAVGRRGPTLDQVRTAYSAASWAQNTSYLNMEKQGIQEWTVPATGSYTIECKGARGAGGSHGTNPQYTYPPGKGAKISGTFNLTKNEVICIVVGQEGVAGHPLNTNGGSGGRGGGGGGGSFVYRKTNNLICTIAGGGGGGGQTRGYGGHGSAGQFPVNGFNNLWLDGGLGNGNRGWIDGAYGGRGGGPANDPVLAEWNDAAGGGGGWWSNGEDGLRAINHSGYNGGYGGRGTPWALSNNSTPFVGGFHAADNTDGGQGNGGFGGGGGSGGQTAGGGGGGLTGGGGGNSYGYVRYTGYLVTGTCGGGQGGGSYNNGIDGTKTDEEGNNDGHGSVIITNNTISGNYYNNTFTYSKSSPTITYTFLNNSFSKTGYNFIGWHLYDGNTRINTNSIYSVGDSFTWTLEKNIYYAVAQWVLKTSLITYVANEGTGTLTTNPQTATYDSPFTFQPNNFTRTGYNFKSWDLYEGTNFIAVYSSGKVYGNWDKTGTNYTAKAQWTAESYTITYSENGGTGNVESNIVSYDSPYTFSNNTFTRTGYEFSGWHLYDVNNNRINTNTYGPTTESYLYGTWNIDKNVTAKAQWTPREFTVTFNTNGKGGANGTGYTKEIKQNYNTTVTCPIVTAVGYVFGGWATSAENAESKIVDKAGNTTFTLGAANKSFFAIWTVNTNGTKFSELQSVFGGTDPIQISDYRTESGQTTANSEIRLGIHLRGKSRLS